MYLHDCVLCAALFDKGLRPHKYCLPILKREEHRLALLGAISSGSSKFFLGTDSAPHDKSYVADPTPAIGCKIVPVLHCTVLHCTALHCTALHCTALHCTALHCVALCCTVLHCIALCCTALCCICR